MNSYHEIQNLLMLIFLIAAPQLGTDYVIIEYLRNIYIAVR